ncbi:transglutaminase family protein [Ramlibacter sp.]|uniref:transglutaminase-like domain-containing protein n=1 Tax=Ramlibacter sp. TaxID=1917967 RepID=UPI0035B1BA44
MTPQHDPAPQACLAATDMVDSDHPAVREFAARHAQGATERERAVALYYAVRDQFRYDPYRIVLTPEGLRASQVLANGYGWCVPKAALMAAACRAVGIPARVGFADVRNHLSTERMRQSMTTDVFVWHGYTDVWIDGAWRKATPAFNIELCDRFGLMPLEFDGTGDSIYHPFDKAGNRHMEYLKQRGAWTDVPLAPMIEDFRAVYPNWLQGQTTASALAGGDFLADVAREVAR